ncbi:MAG TPA: hypothetical protein PLV72_03295, partial [Candidatus Magasanikbacteria bacterium]|nr:hypothetical protein [Candidatus Magasanikbacteria bacterium]
NMCTWDVCVNSSGCVALTPPMNPCDDSNWCTKDICDITTSTCSYTFLVNCDDNNSCTDDVCDPITTECYHTTIPNCQ